MANPPSTMAVRPRRARALELDAPEGHILVTRSRYGRTEAVIDQKVHVKPFEVEPAYVRVGGAITNNLGDYNSAKVDVSVSLPCYPEASEIARCYEYASSLVDAFITREKMLATDPNATPETLPPIPNLPTA